MLLLAYVAAETGRDLASDYGGSAYLRGALAAGWPLDDAEGLARRTLATDLASGGNVDHPYEMWNDFEEDLNRLESSDGADMSGEIVDMNGLFPLNRLYSKNEPNTKNRKQYDAIFLRLVKGVQDAYGVKGSPRAFLDSLRYWMGDITAPRDDGRWYADQEPAYERPQRELAYPAELVLVYWEDVEREDVRKVIFGDAGKPGLVDFVTVWGSGKINMNTAPEPIVRAVCPDASRAGAFWSAVKAYRAGKGNDFSKAWYMALAKKAGIAQSALPSYCLGVGSEAFAVRLRCRLGGMLRRQFSVVERRGGDEVGVVFRQSY